MFSKSHLIEEYDYVEFDGHTWTAILDQDKLCLREGRTPKPKSVRPPEVNLIPPTITLPVLTIDHIPNKTVVNTMGVVSGEAIMGANFLRDIAASITDIVGGRSGVYESKLREGREVALKEMMGEAFKLGADTIIGVKVDYETIGNSMLMVVCSGTAVTTSEAP